MSVSSESVGHEGAPGDPNPSGVRARLRDFGVEDAPLLLGATLSRTDAGGTVAVRLTEVEVYLGETDPGSHAFRGQTPRNSVMFGDAGHLYAYFTYGMHVCANVIIGEPGAASAVLFRAGEVIEGKELAEERRRTSKNVHDLASGPARLCVALGISLADNGTDLLGAGGIQLRLATLALAEGEFSRGPRTGVSGEGGSEGYSWRFWTTGDPSVSPYRRAAPRKPTR